MREQRLLAALAVVDVADLLALPPDLVAPRLGVVAHLDVHAHGLPHDPGSVPGASDGRLFARRLGPELQRSLMCAVDVHPELVRARSRQRRRVHVDRKRDLDVLARVGTLTPADLNVCLDAPDLVTVLTDDDELERMRALRFDRVEFEHERDAGAQDGRERRPPDSGDPTGEHEQESFAHLDVVAQQRGRHVHAALPDSCSVCSDCSDTARRTRVSTADAVASTCGRAAAMWRATVRTCAASNASRGRRLGPRWSRCATTAGSRYIVGSRWVAMPTRCSPHCARFVSCTVRSMSTDGCASSVHTVSTRRATCESCTSAPSSNNSGPTCAHARAAPSGSPSSLSAARNSRSRSRNQRSWWKAESVAWCIAMPAPSDPSAVLRRNRPIDARSGSALPTRNSDSSRASHATAMWPTKFTKGDSRSRA